MFFCLRFSCQLILVAIQQCQWNAVGVCQSQLITLTSTTWEGFVVVRVWPDLLCLPETTVLFRTQLAFHYLVCCVCGPGLRLLLV